MLDLAELRNIRNIAKRPRVVSLISSEIRKLEKVIFLTVYLPSFVTFFAVYLFDMILLTWNFNGFVLLSMDWYCDVWLLSAYSWKSSGVFAFRSIFLCLTEPMFYFKGLLPICKSIFCGDWDTRLCLIWLFFVVIFFFLSL